jgi:hypothetical protein
MIKQFSTIERSTTHISQKFSNSSKEKQDRSTESIASPPFENLPKKEVNESKGTTEIVAVKSTMIAMRLISLMTKRKMKMTMMTKVIAMC